jgi:hypothetical protein
MLIFLEDKQNVYAETQTLHLSAHKIRALDPRARYVFVITSHIFNELMLLQKLAHVTRLPPNIAGPRADASVGLSMFVIRMLVGKAHEALTMLRRQSTMNELSRYFNLVPGLAEGWSEAIAFADGMTWMSNVRNQGAFHYPTAGQLLPHMTEELCEDAYVLVGRRYADTYFHWPEIVASIPALKEVNAGDPMAGLGQMLDQLGELLGRVIDCLALGLQAFMGEHLMPEDRGLDDPVRFEAPDFDGFHLPYFFADPRLDDGRSDAPSGAST